MRPINVWTDKGDFNLDELEIKDEIIETDEELVLETEFLKDGNVVRRDRQVLCSFDQPGTRIGIADSWIDADEAINILHHSADAFATYMDTKKTGRELRMIRYSRNELDRVHVVDVRSNCRNVHTVWIKDGRLVANGCAVNVYAGVDIRIGQGKVA